MLINNWNISEANARQWNAAFNPSELKNDSEWIAGSKIPVIRKNRIGFKPLVLTLMVKGSDRDDILNNCSMIVSKCVDKVVLTLDNRSHRFVGILKKSSIDEKVLDRWHKLKLEFDTYEIGDEVTEAAEKTLTFSVTNPGNADTPVKLTITPRTNSPSLTVTGMGKTITIKNLKQSVPIVLDGVTGLFTEGDSIKKDLEIWGLPSVPPGESSIAFSEFVNVSISFDPVYV